MSVAPATVGVHLERLGQLIDALKCVQQAVCLLRTGLGSGSPFIFIFIINIGIPKQQGTCREVFEVHGS